MRGSTIMIVCGLVAIVLCGASLMRQLDESSTKATEVNNKTECIQPATTKNEVVQPENKPANNDHQEEIYLYGDDFGGFPVEVRLEIKPQHRLMLCVQASDFNQPEIDTALIYLKTQVEKIYHEHVVMIENGLFIYFSGGYPIWGPYIYFDGSLYHRCLFFGENAYMDNKTIVTEGGKSYPPHYPYNL